MSSLSWWRRGGVGLQAGLEVADILLVDVGDDFVFGAADAAELGLGREEFAEMSVKIEHDAIHGRFQFEIVELFLDGGAGAPEISTSFLRFMTSVWFCWRICLRSFLAFSSSTMAMLSASKVFGACRLRSPGSAGRRWRAGRGIGGCGRRCRRRRPSAAGAGGFHPPARR